MNTYSQETIDRMPTRAIIERLRLLELYSEKSRHELEVAEKQLRDELERRENYATTLIEEGEL